MADGVNAAMDPVQAACLGAPCHCGRIQAGTAELLVGGDPVLLARDVSHGSVGCDDLLSHTDNKSSQAWTLPLRGKLGSILRSWRAAWSSWCVEA